MWAPPVFDGRPGERPDWDALLADGAVTYNGPTYSAGRVRVLGATVYAETYAAPGDGDRAVRRWHRRTAASLALAGGLVGAAVGWRVRGRSAGPGDWRLGLAAAAGVFVLVGEAGVPGAPGRPLFDDAPGLAPKDWAERATAFAWGAAGLCVPAVAAGWAAQVVAGAFGIRLPARPLPDQAADYDDRAGGRGLRGA